MASLRVAVAGAGGIGKHHANWHASAGSQVVAFLGRRPEAVQATTAALRDTIGFDGTGYTDFAEMIAAERPDVLDICTPNECHFDNVRAALEAGCHVLCEKPLVWAAEHTETIRQAHELARLASASGRHVGLCSQYAAALTQYRRLFPELDVAACETFETTMETLSRASRGWNRAADEVWVDMGPHPLSLVLAAWPQAVLDPGSIQVDFSGRRADVSFHVDDAGRRCACRVVVADCDEGPLERAFAFDGQRVDLAGRADDNGVYRSVMAHGEVEDVSDDFMDLLISQFTRVATGAEAQPLVPIDVAVHNVEMLAAIHASA